VVIFQHPIAAHVVLVPASYAEDFTLIGN
jgi:hypothetical protein